MLELSRKEAGTQIFRYNGRVNIKKKKFPGKLLPSSPAEEKTPPS